MRSEKEMLELIVGTAEVDPKVRVVLLEGSRAYPGGARDPFQDYDVVYGVTELEPYWNNREWIERFGELMILQMPDLMGEANTSSREKFTYLMQFMDGSRIDLNLYTLEYLKRHTLSSESTLLLDKDGLLPILDAPSDRDYVPKPPNEKEFFDSCNEFWWVAPYVAKGLWRGDIGYAKYHLDSILRPEAMKMMDWYFGIKTKFQKNPGKHGKHFHTCIEPEICNLLLKTYADADVNRTWDALFSLCAVFRKVAIQVAAHFEYAYPAQDDKKVNGHLEEVRRQAVKP